MADFFVRHGLNPDKLVRFSITITQIHSVIKEHEPPEELLTEYPRVEGDEVWILEIGTYELDTNGDEIPTRKIYLTTLSDVDKEIQDVVEEMCVLIDWEPLRSDAQAPYVYWYLPNDGTIVEGEHSAEVFNVPITVDVYVKIRDSLPAVGIDYSSVDVKLEVYTPETKEFDITSEVEITGSPYDLQLYWHPPIRVWDEYGG